MARQKRSCSAGTGGRGQRTGRSAKARPDGSAAMHRGTAARHPIETGQGGGGQGCGFRMEQKLSECCTGKELPPGRRTPSMRFLPKQSRQKWRGTQFLTEPGKGSKGTIRRRNWEKGPRTMGALKCVRPVRAGAAAGSRRLRRPHSIPPAAGPSCAAPACP